MARDDVQDLMRGVQQGRLSRRQFIKRAAALGLSAPAVVAFLAACGGDAPATVGAAATNPAGAATAVATQVQAAATQVAGGTPTPTRAATTATRTPATVTRAATAATRTPGGAAGTGPTTGSIKVYSSFPRTGTNKGQTDGIINSIKLAFEQVNSRAGNFTIVYGQTEDLDDGTPANSGNWDAAQEAANANRAIADADCMVYIGTLNSGAAKVAVPILNRASLGMISPANTNVGLTKPFEAGEPGVYYPAGPRNYCRVVANDAIQGPVGAAYANEIGAKRLYVLDDNETYGKGLATLFAADAKRIGITVLAQESIDKAATDYRSLAQKIRTANADMVYFGGITGNNAGKLWQDLRGVLGKDFKLMGADGIFEDSWLEAAGDAAEGSFVTFAGLPPDKLTGKGVQWYQQYKAKYNIEPSAYAAYGYECASVVVNAIQRAGVKNRESIRAALLGTRDFDGVLGKFSFDADGDTTLTAMSVNTVKGGKFEFVKAQEAAR